MTREIQCSYMTGRTVYFLVRDRTGQIWNGAAWEAYLTADYTTYSVSMTEQGSASSFYVGNFPTTIVPGIYSICAKEQKGGTVAESDPTIATGDYQWNGVATFPLSDLATSGQLAQIGPLRIARGTMVKPFNFKMVSSADHVTNAVSGVISGQISRDAGAFGALQSGAFTEIGLGWYSLQALTSGDTLANNVALVFTGVGVSGGQFDQRDFSFITQRTSGQ